MKIVRVLVDTGSSHTIVRNRVLPSWVLSKASEDEACTYSTLSGSFQTNRKTRMALQLVQFAPHRTNTHEVALLEDSPATRKDESKPDIIIGRDLIKALGLTLDFAAEPPTIS
jgi:predicted aspartyl protease